MKRLTELEAISDGQVPCVNRIDISYYKANTQVCLILNYIYCNWPKWKKMYRMVCPNIIVEYTTYYLFANNIVQKLLMFVSTFVTQQLIH